MPRRKDPFPDWRPGAIRSQDNKAIIDAIESTPDMNLGVVLSGRLVDVDIDADHALVTEAIDYFLANTPFVWGRKSKPRTHRIFFLTKDFDRAPHSKVLQYMKTLEIGGTSFSVELRGGSPENGLMSVLPGSVHPSGETYDWATNFDPTRGGTVVEEYDLIRGLRMSLAAAVLATYWREGTRNDMSLAFAGLSWRIRSASLAAMQVDDEEEVDPDLFVLRQDMAERVLNAAMTIGGDDEKDKRSRILNFNNTWKKLDENPEAKVTGGKKLAELIGGSEGEKAMRVLYRLLSDNDGIEQLEDLAEQFVVWYRAGLLVDMELVTRGEGTPWMSREQARNSLGSRTIRFGTKSIKVADLLFTSPMIRRVQGITFDPSQHIHIVETEHGPKINQWMGFAIPPCDEPVTEADVEPFLSYVREVLANGDDALYQWILAWVADTFKEPDKKPKTALVLVGVQGAGKTFLGEKVIGPLIGKTHYAKVNSITDLTDRFNVVVDNKIFLQCDEAIHAYQRDAASRLKSIISDEVIKIEPKGVDPMLKPNHLRMLFTSNEENAAVFIDASPFERRFTVAHVSPKRARDLHYWAAMHEWIETNLSRLHRFFLLHKYDKKMIQRPVETEAKRNIQRVGVDMEVAWILERCASGFILSDEMHEHWWQAFNSVHITDDDQNRNQLRRDYWPDLVCVGAIENDFKHFVRSRGKQVHSGSLQTSLRKVFPRDSMTLQGKVTVRYLDRNERSVMKRVRLYTFPSVDEILNHLKVVYGGIIEQIMDDLSNSGPDLEFNKSKQRTKF